MRNAIVLVSLSHAIWFPAMVPQAVAQPPANKKPPKITGDEIPLEVQQMAQEAEQLSSTTSKLGKRLLEILGGKTQPRRARGQAARTLGKLRYPPAIPKLIEFIELEDWPLNKPVDEIPPIRDFCPCVAALLDFGMEAVPQVLNAYLAEKNDRRQSLLSASFSDAIAKEISIYAQGVAFDKDDPYVKRQVQVLIRDLRTVNDTVTWPLKWTVKP